MANIEVLGLWLLHISSGDKNRCSQTRQVFPYKTISALFKKRDINGKLFLCFWTEETLTGGRWETKHLLDHPGFLTVPFQMAASLKFSLSPLRHSNNLSLSCPSPHCTPTTLWSYTDSALKTTCMTTTCNQGLAACCFFILPQFCWHCPLEHKLRCTGPAVSRTAGLGHALLPSTADSEPKPFKLYRLSRRTTHKAHSRGQKWIWVVQVHRPAH